MVSEVKEVSQKVDLKLQKQSLANGKFEGTEKKKKRISQLQRVDLIIMTYPWLGNGFAE